MQKTIKFLLAFFLSLGSFQTQAGQFVSLNLGSDRLLIELAEPAQISAMSPYSKNPLMMLDKVNIDKPTIEPKLVELLPYLDKTILVNEYFYPQLVESLRKLGANVILLNDTAQTPEQLFALILQLGKLTENEEKAEKLVAKLKSQNFRLNLPLAETLILSDTGIVETRLPQYQTLLDLLGLTPLNTTLTQQNFSLEKVLLSQPNVLISLTDKQGYNEQAELLNHPILQKMFTNRPLASAPLKYTYCFDHGIWQGVEILYHQLN